MRNEFVFLTNYSSLFKVDPKYHTGDNFTGEKVPGYEINDLLFSKVGAERLLHIANELKLEKLYLKIFDAYRPKRAVQFFQDWEHKADKIELKKKFYPNLTKSEIFDQGFIARDSRHSYGGAVDLTLVDEFGVEVDMGSPFDLFGEESFTDYSKITKLQMTNRMKLKTIMEENGFQNFYMEWWHYSLVNEPFPKTSFDFPIE